MEFHTFLPGNDTSLLGTKPWSLANATMDPVNVTVEDKTRKGHSNNYP